MKCMETSKENLNNDGLSRWEDTEQYWVLYYKKDIFMDYSLTV